MANPKLSTLQDNFMAASLNTSLWNNVTAGAVTLDTVNDLVALNVGTANGIFNNFAATGPYDATASSMYAQVTPPPNGNGGITTYFKLQADASNLIQFQLAAGGAFSVYVRNAGTWTGTPLPTYDAHQHRWWRLREAGGSFTADTSPDGYTWTTLATVPYTWSATAVSAWFQTGTTDTEPSGMIATISHVNTLLGGPQNPFWPAIEDAWGPRWNCNGGDSPLDAYVDVADRTQGTLSTSRGRQYELDQVQSGTVSMTLENTDGNLDPSNTAGPWYGHILPYQPYRRRAQWPPTRNLLSQAQATGGDLGGQPLGPINWRNNGPSIFTSTDPSFGAFVASSTAWAGSTVMQFAVPTTSAVTWVVYTPQVAVEPGQTYSSTLRVRNITASSSVQVFGTLRWQDATQTLISTADAPTVTLTGGSTAWTTLTVTGVAPANAALMLVGVRLAAVPSVACSVQVDGWQAERGTPSTWTCPGVWYSLYAGFVERWPMQWDMQGTYGMVQPTGVDAISLLSQKILSDPLTQEINNNAPRFLFKLDDPAGSASAADATGTYPAAQLAASKYGAGSLTFGNAITAASATGAYTGSSGTVVTIANANPGVNTYTAAATYIPLSHVGITGPADLSQWTRMIAFRYTAGTPTNGTTFWSSFDKTRSGGIPAGSTLYFALNNAGHFNVTMSGPAGTWTSFYPTQVNIADSNWHLAIASYSRATAQLLICLDGGVWVWGAFDPALEPSGLISDSLGAYVDTVIGGATDYNFKGDLSYAAEFPTALNGTQMGNIYSAWKSACAGESTSARYARILRYSGYIGPSVIDTGLTTAMGPAAIDGQDATTALQAVVDTENGSHYVDTTGAVTFKSRAARYNAATPIYIFGERNDLGEWPYEDCQLDYDPTHLANQVTVTQEATQQLFYAQDQTSITNFFPRTLARTINASSDLECVDAANYLLSRYKQPAMRVSALKLHPSAIPQMWPVCLSLEIGTRIRVMRRAPRAPAIAVDCFVENVAWDMDDQGEAIVTLQCSPADSTPYAVFSAWHTTLAAPVTAGALSITVAAGQDHTNPLAAQITAGQQLVLGQGTANAETVTIKTVGGSSSGWTSATVALTAATTAAHSTGDTVCTPLPSGTTNPAAWDASSALDAVAFAY